GAAVGLLSMRANNQALEKIVNSQRTATALKQAEDHYTDTLSQLNRALITLAAGRDSTSGYSSNLPPDVIRLLENAKDAYQRSLTAFAEYLNLAEASSVSDEAHFANNVRTAYMSLMDNGMPGLFNALEKGRINEFNQIFVKQTRSLESDFFTAVETVKNHQQNIIDRTYSSQIRYYEYVVIIVSMGMLLCILIALLAYMFLGQMVLRPLGQAMKHF